MLTNYTTGDAVTTLIYASAINIILARSVGISELYNLLGIGVSLFIFIDWLNRIWIPSGFSPIEDQERRREPLVMILKASLEIAAVFFLVSATVGLFAPDEYKNLGNILRDRQAFSIFLAVSFFWNLLLLRVMEDLSYWELFARTVLLGTVFDAKGADTYTGGLKNRMMVARANRNERYNRFHGVCFLEGLGRTSAQLAGHHVTWVNLLVSLLLLFGVESFFLLRNAGDWIGGSWNLRILIITCVVFVPTILYFFGTAIAEGSDRNAFVVNLLDILGAILTLLLLLLFYMTFDTELMKYVMIVQHTVWGVFLSYAAHPNSPRTPIVRDTAGSEQ